MTEDQAKTKWCPFARVISWGGVTPWFLRLVGFWRAVAGYNRSARGDVVCARCLAADCMAWREETISMLNEPAVIVGSHGWCGLAGKDGAP